MFTSTKKYSVSVDHDDTDADAIDASEESVIDDDSEFPTAAQREHYEAVLMAERESDRLFDLLKQITAKIELGTGQEIDVLTMKKAEIQQLFDQANERVHALELEIEQSVTSDAVPASFEDVEEDAPSTLTPLLKRTQQLLKSRRASPQRPLEPLADTRQIDLFIADLLDYNLKDDTASMEAPLFSLATKPDLKIWSWTSADGKRWLEVTPSVKGRATMHDKDVLIYLTSQLVAAMNDSLRTGKKMPGRRVRFTLYDYLRATNKNTGGAVYARFVDTLDRLAGTRLKTNISFKNVNTLDSFGLIERFKIIQAENDSRLAAIEVTLSEWLYSAIEEKEVLTINRGYFNLRKPLEKKLYELARKHVGAQAEWSIEERNLFDKTGSQASIKEFRRMFGDIIKSDSIPDYRFLPVETGSKTMIRIYQKDPQRLIEAIAKQEKKRGKKP